MKKKIIVILIAVALIGIGLFQAIPALADSANPLSYVTITPTSVTLDAGGTQQFSAQAYDAQGNTKSDVNYFWMTNSGGTINTTGLFTTGSTAGIYNDAVEVVAVKGSLTAVAFATVTVGSVGPLDHIAITPFNPTVIVNGTYQFTAQGYDASSNIITGLTYTWTTTGANISSSGLFTAGSAAGTEEVTAAVGSISTTVSVTVVATAGTLDHVVITPASATVKTGGTRQFTAQGYDASDVAITGLTYTWSIVAGGGSISDSGLFAAGTTTGTFTDTVKVTVTEGSVTETNTATVIIATNPTNNANNPNNAIKRIPKLDINQLIRMFNGYVNSSGFDNFLGGQWQVKNGTAIDTVKIIPGLVQSASATSLVIIPNGQTATSTFTLTSSTVIQSGKTSLAANDQVVVVTVNDEVRMVVKIAATNSAQMPPGLRNHQGNRNGKNPPPGWSHGQKVGWGNQSPNNGNQPPDNGNQGQTGND